MESRMTTSSLDMNFDTSDFKVALRFFSCEGSLSYFSKKINQSLKIFFFVHLKITRIK